MEKKLTVQKITPNLWFDKNGEEAVKFYVSIFQDSRIGRVTHYTKEGFEIHQMPEGTVMTMEFQIEGQEFVALNAGPVFTFNEAISFVVNCSSQEEVDYYWNKLSEGGDPNAQMCGWLKDKFGVSWQVVPTELTDLLQDKDTARVSRVTNAIFKMKKLDIGELRKAHGGI
ncbi:VOC family protein [Chitinophaga solisilvae]|uniref:VOC family protein n=1 Tax=Chitinophaga solisilvae TaxID=1233460 RepID=A0A9Q5D3K6_9BACT|nr:VOC family protein [Chitinophaga solisilvae]NSL85600.1 VOC family protein [Chitinophaga solisilvae]